MTRPRVGDRLVLYSSTGRRRLMTTVIERALSTDSENVFYLQTANSLYRVELSELPDVGGDDNEHSESDAELDQHISREFN